MIVAVADSGVGTSKEVQARVVEPFFTTEGGRGSGVDAVIANPYRGEEVEQALVEAAAALG